MEKEIMKSRKNFQNNLENLVGSDVYKMWLDMLQVLVPHGRTLE